MGFIKSISIFFVIIFTIYLCIPAGKKIITRDYMVTVKENFPWLESEENVIGYLYFPSLKSKRSIKVGTNKEILDQNYIGLLDLSYKLDDLYGNIVLAGHNRNEAFHLLYRLKLRDEIVLTTKKQNIWFTITEIVTINDDDYSYFELHPDDKVITLVTCTPDNKHRLMIRGQTKNTE